MLFKATLIAVIVYLAVCYAYGLYLLWKLYTGRRLHLDAASLGENPAPRTEQQDTAGAPRRAQPGYNAPAKAA